MVVDRLCWRILRRSLHVLFHGTAGAKDDGHYIRRDICPRSVSIFDSIVPRGHILTVPSSILCTVPTHQLGMIYAGRLLTGLGVGGIAAASPIYTSEIAPPAIRGRLTGLYVRSSSWPDFRWTDMPLALSRPIRLARLSDCKWTLSASTLIVIDCCSWINYGIVHNVNGSDSKAWRIPSKPHNTQGRGSGGGATN
jgi:hypothetical protein